MIRSLFGKVLCGCIFLTVPHLQATTFASVKGMGMGRTGAVFPQDTLAAAYNPAGMVYQGDRVDIETTWSQPDGAATITGSNLIGGNGLFRATHSRDFYAPSFGLNVMLCNSTDASVGLTGYVHDHYRASYTTAIPAFGTSPPELDYTVGTLAPSLALRFDGHAIGVAALIHEARVVVNGLQRFTFPFYTTSPGEVTNRGANTALGFGVSIGYMGRITPWLRVGIAWEIPIWMEELDKYRGFIPAERLVPPQRITGGIHMNFCRTVNVVLEAQHILWHQNRFWSHSSFENSADLTSQPFGSPEGPGLGWRDETRLGGGIDVTIDRLTLRAGGSWTHLPTRNSQSYLNILTVNTIDTWATAGFTLKLACYELSGFYAWGFRSTLNGTDQIPPIPSGGGRTSLRNQEQRIGATIAYKW